MRLQQVLCRLPDTSSMKAVIRVQEGQVSKLRVDDNNPMRATVSIVGFKKPIGANVAQDQRAGGLEPALVEPGHQGIPGGPGAG